MSRPGLRYSPRGWDPDLPLLLIGWVTLVIMEQALPVTWRHRGRLNGAVRATAAIVLSSSSFYFALSFEVVCH